MSDFQLLLMVVAKGKKQIMAIVPVQDYERLKALAEEEQRTVSQMTAVLLRQALDYRENRNENTQ